MIAEGTGLRRFDHRQHQLIAGDGGVAGVDIFLGKALVADRAGGDDNVADVEVGALGARGADAQEGVHAAVLHEVHHCDLGVRAAAAGGTDDDLRVLIAAAEDGEHRIAGDLPDVGHRVGDDVRRILGKAQRIADRQDRIPAQFVSAPESRQDRFSIHLKEGRLVSIDLAHKSPSFLFHRLFQLCQFHRDVRRGDRVVEDKTDIRFQAFAVCDLLACIEQVGGLRFLRAGRHAE